MLIGEVAAITGVDSQTIRFYERQGLLPAPRREPNGYRSYDDAAIGRLQFIRAAQAAGLTLTEIASIVHLRDAGQTPCTHVSLLLDRKLDDVRTRQRELSILATELEQLIEASHDLDPRNCADADICHIIGRAGKGRTNSVTGLSS
ncbi:heavy metal-responsive transcriptional regulator [Arthrobacter castelli]|uniref:heavy metal-responsive transcriptional regulator n=1 Tax=Arthrobacter castelli TaxID=271431 RepID=UPI0004168A3C|nr:heavy metal-responsive transcriptional regulator [Arthrobacter castelli]